MKRFLLLFLTCLQLAHAETSQTVHNESPSNDAQLARIESRLELIERKFAMLSAKSEQELNGVSSVLSDPKLLLQQADYALKVEKSLTRAYRYLAILHAMHPSSAEDKAAFFIAASIFQKLYFQNRYSSPNSAWTTVEPVFMFQWVSSFFSVETSSFPKSEVEMLVVGVPVEMLRLYEKFSASNPSMARWKLHFTDDNGVVESITPIPANAKQTSP